MHGTIVSCTISQIHIHYIVISKYVLLLPLLEHAESVYDFMSLGPSLQLSFSNIPVDLLSSMNKN